METRHLFDRLPPGIFKPLASMSSALNWRVLEHLQVRVFDDDSAMPEYGYPRKTVIEAIETVIETYPNLVTADEDEVENGNGETGINTTDLQSSPVNARANMICRRLLNCGWLQEERRGYHSYLSMPQPASQLLTALLEIAEGRPLFVSGNLKFMRSSIDDIVKDPSGQVDALATLAGNASRFSRHLKGIRGAIKTLYDQIRPPMPAREVVNSFFDKFLREIFIRDYATIKTSDNPLSIREHLLQQISAGLRYHTDNYNKLLAGYQNLYPDGSAKINLERDLSRLYSVFYNIDSQLDAIDTMKVRYEQRVDTVIDYARRSPRKTGKVLKQIISALAKQADLQPEYEVRMPWATGEAIGEERIFNPRRPRIPPEPQAIRVHAPDPELMKRIQYERRMRDAARVTEQGLLDIIQQKSGNRITSELSQFELLSIRDYYHVIALRRLALMEQIKPGKAKESYPKLFSQYRITSTDEIVETPYFITTEVTIQKVISHD